MGEIFKYYNKDVEYKPTQYLEEKEYFKSELFFRELNHYGGDDLFCFKYHNAEISFCNLSTTILENDKKLQEFRGVFFKAKFDQEFKGKVIILDFLQFDKPELTGMNILMVEDREFNQEFTIFCNDQNLASNILQESFIHNLLELKNRLKASIRVSFIDGSFYLAASYNTNQFEPNINKSVLEYENISKDIEIFESLMQIADNLRLNEEFWLNPARLEEEDFKKNIDLPDL